MPLTNHEINNAILATLRSEKPDCQKLDELRSLYADNHPCMNRSNLTTLLTHLASICSDAPSSFRLKKAYREFFMNVLTQSIDLLAHEKSPGTCVAILHACAKMDIQSHRLLDILDYFIQPEILCESNAQQCTLVCLSLIKLNLLEVEKAKSILVHFKQALLLSTEKQSHLADMLYVISSLSILKPQKAGILTEPLQFLLNKSFNEASVIPVKLYTRFWIFLASLHHGFLPNIQLPPALQNRKLMQGFTRHTQKDHSASSSSELEVIWRDHIERHFHDQEVIPDSYKGAFQLDLLVNGRYNIEIDGPHHYIKRGESYQLRPNNQVRDALLAALGITVIRLPFYELNTIKNADISTYLQEKLKMILPTATSSPQSSLRLDALEFRPSKVASSSTLSLGNASDPGSTTASSGNASSSASAMLDSSEDLSAASEIISSRPKMMHRPKAVTDELDTHSNRSRAYSYPSKMKTAPGMYRTFTAYLSTKV